MKTYVLIYEFISWGTRKISQRHILGIYGYSYLYESLYVATNSLLSTTSLMQKKLDCLANCKKIFLESNCNLDVCNDSRKGN